MNTDLASLSEKLVKAWRFFYKQDYIDGFGHISARIPSDQFLLSRHALGAKVSAQDFLTMDVNGECLSGTGGRCPPSCRSIWRFINSRCMPIPGSLATATEESLWPETLGSCRAALLKSHGVVVRGPISRKWLRALLFWRTTPAAPGLAQAWGSWNISMRGHG